MAFPKTPGKYEALMRLIAASHPKINNDSEDRHFAIIDLFPDPWGEPDLEMFLTGLKSKLGFGGVGSTREWVMLVQQVDSNVPKPGKGNDRKELNGAFVLLSKLNNKNDWAERSDIQDMAFIMGEEITVWLAKYFKLNEEFGFLGDVTSEPVSLVRPDMLYGYRWNFNYTAYNLPCYGDVGFHTDPELETE